MTQRLSKITLVSTLLCAVVVSTFVCGCSRRWYRQMADRDAQCLLESRQFDSRWDIPGRNVEPDPRSRLADVNDPDCGPLTRDDDAAGRYMQQPYNSNRRIEYWDRRGTGAMIDAEQWLQYLPYNDDGEVVLTKELAVDLALLHSREFQTQVEQLYLQALSLSQSRFAFNVQWAGGTGATFDFDGAESLPQTLSNPSNLSASRNFASGGQLVVDLLNSVTYQFGGGQSNFATGNLLFRLTQPLLRNAFRHVRTEGLTQTERSLLYSVRDFARFRRQFYLQIVQQYLLLLNQSQQIRIEEENIRNLDRNYERAITQYDQGTIAQIQVDQIFQSRQNARISLISAQQGLQASQDQFKFTLGLPAKVRIRFDESFLEPFKLNSDSMEELLFDVDEVAKSLSKYARRRNEVPDSFIKESYQRIRMLNAQMAELPPEVEREFRRFDEKLKDRAASAGDDFNQKAEVEFQSQLAARLKEDIEDIKADLKDAIKQIDIAEKYEPTQKPSTTIEKPRPEFNDPEAPPKPLQDDSPIAEQQDSKFDRLERTVSKHVVAVMNNLFLTQTKIRLFLIDINPVDIDESTAVELALGNRLDLMNDRARVVDSYRAVEIAADQLESDLNLTGSATLNTDSGRDNGIRFDGESARYSMGLQFDGPLNRFAERNAYRAAQISYQQQRRSYMAAEDSIVNAIRDDLRSLIQNRFNFQTNRQQLIAATRQVDQSRQQALNATESGDSSATQDLLNALNDLRGARNGLISSWINYEVSRISLFVDLELLLLDESGRWINQDERLDYESDEVDELLPKEEADRGDASSAALENDDAKAASDSGTDRKSNDSKSQSDSGDDRIDGAVELPALKPVDQAKGKGNELSQDTPTGRTATGSSRNRSTRRSTGEPFTR